MKVYNENIDRILKIQQNHTDILKEIYRKLGGLNE